MNQHRKKKLKSSTVRSSNSKGLTTKLPPATKQRGRPRGSTKGEEEKTSNLASSSDEDQTSKMSILKTLSIRKTIGRLPGAKSNVIGLK